uniref:Uncharacterized protein n=1 Tax=Romanomermis culicivorax TaxID=13658 RepID=A0A915HJ33_ROMCU
MIEVINDNYFIGSPQLNLGCYRRSRYARVPFFGWRTLSTKWAMRDFVFLNDSLWLLLIASHFGCDVVGSSIIFSESAIGGC